MPEVQTSNYRESDSGKSRRNLDYHILLSGQVVSDFGSYITQLAYPLLFLSLTGSPLQAGLSLALTNLPTFLFGLPAGSIVDRFDRKKVMILCDLLRFLLLGSIPVALYFNHLPLAYLYSAAFISGLCDVIFSTAEQAAVTRVVAKADLTKAFGQYEASTNAASLFGPTIGGFLFQLAQGIPFLVDSLSYLISACSFLFIRSEFQATTKKSLKLSDVLEGARFLWKHEAIRTTTLIRAVSGLVSGGQALILILLAKQLGASPLVIGLLFSVGSIGVVLGSLLSHKIQQQLGVGKTLTSTRYLIALCFALFLLQSNLVALSITTALVFFFVEVYGTVATAYRLQVVPDELQGRVVSFNRMLLFAGLTLGGAVTGLLVEGVGLNSTIVVYALLLVALAAVLSLNSKLFKNPVRV